jgi:hypothetical protein
VGAADESWQLEFAFDEAAHDLWRAEKRRRPKIQPLKIAA